MENEIWKDIPGYEGLYQISNLGRVLSLKYAGGKTSKIKTLGKTHGYLFAGLYKNKCVKYFRINRLVAQAFLGLNINDRWTLVCHIDDNPSNNIVENLFLGTMKDNMQDCINKGRFKFAPLQIKYDKSFHKSIIEMTKEGLSTRRIAEIIGMGKSNVHVIQKLYFINNSNVR